MKKLLLALALIPALAFGQKIQVINSTTGASAAVTMSGGASIGTTGTVALDSASVTAGIVGVMAKLSVTSINAKTTGATTIGTTLNNGLNFHPLFAVIECTSASTITIPASLSIGTNSTSYNNTLAITAATGLTASGGYLSVNLATAVNTVIAPNTAVKVNITTGATGTSQTVSVTLLGYYQ